MEFIETPIFTKQILKLLSEESYREFQNEVFKNPQIGKLIKGGGGIRKIRWHFLIQEKVAEFESSIITRIPITKFFCYLHI